MAEVYWRVKKWFFEFDLTWSEGVDPSISLWQFSSGSQAGPPQTVSFVGDNYFFELEEGNIDFSGAYGPPYANEKGLVCLPSEFTVVFPGIEEPIFNGNPFWILQFAYANVIAVSGSSPGGTNFFIGLHYDHPNFFSKTLNYVNSDTGLFAPRFLETFIVNTRRWTAKLGDPNNPPTPTDYGYFELKTPSKNYRFPIAAAKKQGQPPGGEFYLTASLYPLEYWEYDPGDGGGPIYDKDTGKQLRPFP